jgi:putative methionine-R-sulfoxide reductase with GAF domain
MNVARDYAHLLATPFPKSDRGEAMARVVELLWTAFGEQDPQKTTGGLVSWVGFYEIAPEEQEMILACREPKPACSPIGLQGLCGRGWKEGRAFVVNDVAVLGEGYIACDPRDQSEAVVPMIEGGRCWGVLDVDSYHVGAFTQRDACEMDRLCRLAGLTTGVEQVITLG